MLHIEEFTYSEEYECYFAKATINGVEFAILFKEANAEVTILKKYDVSEDVMEEYVDPYSELLMMLVALYFNLR